MTEEKKTLMKDPDHDMRDDVIIDDGGGFVKTPSHNVLMMLEFNERHDDVPTPIPPQNGMIIYVSTDKGFDIPFNKNPKIAVSFDPKDITTESVEKKMLGLGKNKHYYTPAFKLYMIRPTDINPVVEIGLPAHYASDGAREISPNKLDIQISYQFKINEPEDVNRILGRFDKHYKAGAWKGYPTKEVTNEMMIAPIINNIKNNFRATSFTFTSVMQFYEDLTKRFKDLLIDDPDVKATRIWINNVVVSCVLNETEQGISLKTQYEELAKRKQLWEDAGRMFMSFDINEQRNFSLRKAENKN